MNKAQETLSEMAKDLHEVGAIDKITLRQFDVKSLSPVAGSKSPSDRIIKPTLFSQNLQFLSFFSG